MPRQEMSILDKVNFFTETLDRKKYDELSTVYDWYVQIAMRTILMHSDLCDDLYEFIINSPAKLDPSESKIFYALFDDWKELNINNPSDTFSVRSTPVYYIWKYRQDERLEDIWNCCEQYELNLFNIENKKLIHTPIDDFYERRDLDKLIHNITVDLDASNEQILKDFRHWLTETRKKNPRGHEKKQRIEKFNFGEKDFGDWIEERVLYAFDVKFIADYNKIELSDAEIAEIVFFDQDESVCADKLNKFVARTKKTLAWLFTIPTVIALGTQIYSEKQNDAASDSKKKTC